MTSSTNRKRDAHNKPRPDDPEQSKAFIEKAREIEANEKKSGADKVMRRLAKQEPRPHKAKRDE